MRAQELSITTVIIAALAIIVLIVLAMIVTQRTNIFGRNLRNVSEQRCEDVGVARPIGTPCTVIYGSFPGLRADQICCEREGSNSS